MKTAKGFKGRYFSLQAIAATTSCAKLHSQTSAWSERCERAETYDLEEEADPLDSLALLQDGVLLLEDSSSVKIRYAVDFTAHSPPFHHLLSHQPTTTKPTTYNNQG